jgi:hypothetical protein
MEASRSKFAVKLLPSLTDFAILMPAAFLFGRAGGVKTLLGDCDTGWHIRAGEWIIANHQAPAHDIFSFSKAGQPWFAWEWLSDVILAGLNAIGGLQLVALFAILLITATFTGLYLLVRGKSNPVVAILITMIAAAASSIHWLARPHLFTLLFLVLFIAALERVRDGRTHFAGVPILWILPVITVLWTNLHGGFFVGALMVGAYGLGELLRLLIAPADEDRRDVLRSARNYLICAAGCMAASLINPYTYRLHLHMIQYLRDPWNSQYILEFLSPDFHHPIAPFFEAMLVMSGLACVAHVSRGRFTEAILMLVWAHAGLLATRNIPIFMIVAALPVASAIQQWLRTLPQRKIAAWLSHAVSRFNRIASDTAVAEALPRFHLPSLAGLVVLAAIIYAPHPPKRFRAEFDPEVYPAKAVAMLKADPSARIFTHDEWGDYLIYSLYPDNRVFVDGRSDFYGDAFEEKYQDLLKVRYGWDQTLERYGVNTILMPPDAPLAGALKESSRWRVAYDDGVALVFRPAQQAAGQRAAAAESGSEVRGIDGAKAGAGEPAIAQIKPKSKS